MQQKVEDRSRLRQTALLKIETAIKELPGVKNASVSFMAQKLLLEADDDKFDAVLKDAVKGCEEGRA